MATSASTLESRMRDLLPELERIYTQVLANAPSEPAASAIRFWHSRSSPFAP
jgi:hypothetical protein